MDDRKLDSIYSADEAAERLRITKRALIKLARHNGHCSRSGRTYLFSEADLLAIWQDMREPATERRVSMPAVPAPSSHSIMEELKWRLSSPPTSVDKRVLGILRWLEKQKTPKTYNQIDRAGPRTIDELLAKGMVTNCGMDADGLVRVQIATAGKDQIRIAERWKAKREARKAAGYAR
ncbi:helix-turn-helix domain-containing protein [Aquamicrobium defluvii]|uniref:helix-turn-helix domain-containing protein n=1 Tax=Aquamicrobium defluvii TaxID=69279 RepID=UPI00044A8CA4|nr:helix-turn-helix domain-containing protein [Aquamicrobium defluvii]EZQ16788.1 hypothetical protein CF98_39925 [Halopseudomonas bauzanensis]